MIILAILSCLLKLLLSFSYSPIRRADSLCRTGQHNTTLHYTTQHNTTQLTTTLHNSPQRNIKQQRATSTGGYQLSNVSSLLRLLCVFFASSMRLRCVVCVEKIQFASLRFRQQQVEWLTSLTTTKCVWLLFANTRTRRIFCQPFLIVYRLDSRQLIPTLALMQSSCLLLSNVM